jgi:hypothetical protein
MPQREMVSELGRKRRIMIRGYNNGSHCIIVHNFIFSVRIHTPLPFRKRTIFQIIGC